jgi:hypothetical protein
MNQVLYAVFQACFGDRLFEVIQGRFEDGVVVVVDGNALASGYRCGYLKGLAKGFKNGFVW